MVAAARYRPGRRRAGIAGQGQQAAARPIGGDVKARKAGVRPLFAKTRQVGIDEAGVPWRDVLVFEAELLTRRVRGVDDQHIGPLDHPPQDFRRAGRLQVDGDATLVAVVQVPLIRLPRDWLWRDLVRDPPELALRRLDLDD